MSLELLSELLRDPDQAARGCHEPVALRERAAWALATTLVGGMLFGAVVGSFRGSQQIAYAALKLPLATLAALAICGPAFYALAAALGRVWPFRTVLLLALLAGARSSLVLLAFAPPLWLAIACGASYHLVKLLAVLVYAAAGASALSLIVRALGKGAGRLATAATFVGVFLLVGGQTAWILRPFLGDPKDPVPPFIARGAEGGGVIGAVTRSSQAVLGRGR